MLAELAKDTDTGVRAAVAGNPSASPPVFAELARDHAESVRLAAANSIHPDSELAKHERDWRQHRETSYAGAFESLSGDPEVTVREAIADNGKVAWSVVSEKALDRL